MEARSIGGPAGPGQAECAGAEPGQGQGWAQRAFVSLDRGWEWEGWVSCSLQAWVPQGASGSRLPRDPLRGEQGCLMQWDI